MWIRALIIQNAKRARTIVTGLEDYSEISAVLGDLCDATNTAQALDVHIDGGLPVSIAGKVVGKETSPPMYGIQFRVIEGHDCMCHEFFSLLDSDDAVAGKRQLRFFSQRFKQ
jgi:hypothetical protein